VQIKNCTHQTLEGDIMKNTFAKLAVLVALTSCGKGAQDNSNLYVDERIYPTNSQGVVYAPSFESLGSMLKTFGTDLTTNLPTDSRYTQLVVKQDFTMTKMNYLQFPEGAKKVVITGKKIILDRSQTQKFYLMLNQKPDIAEVVIEAEEIVIGAPLELPGTKVILRADILKFENDGVLITTPVSLDYRATPITVENNGQTLIYPKAGENGLNAGDIYLYINAIKEDNTGLVRLVTNGGKGQQGSPGMHGANGENASTLGGGDYYKVRTQKCVNYEPDRSGARFKSRRCSWAEEKGRAASNGKDATSAGAPGQGGNAGNIYTTLNLISSLVSRNPGTMATVDSTIYKGGEPGKPNRTCVKNIEGNKVTSSDCIVAVNGRDAAVVKVVAQNATSGEVKAIEADKNILSDKAIWAMLRFAKDTYQNGNTIFASNLLARIDGEVKKAKDKSIELMQVENEIHSLFARLDARQDYYGNTAGWVPNLSFEVNLKNYENEAKRSINLLLLTKKLMSFAETSKANEDDLERLQDQYLKDIKANSQRITEFTHQAALTQELIQDLLRQENEFNFELTMLENEIKEQARQNLKVPFMDKAVKIFATASKVIPVGQPSLGVIGMGVEFFHNATNGSMNRHEIIESIPSVAKAFQTLDMKTAANELQQKLSELDPSNLKRISNAERLEYFKQVHAFSSPVVKAISEQMAQFKKLEVSKSALESEINKIKSSHPIYKDIAAKLEVLIAKREMFYITMKKMTTQMADLTNSISQDYLAIAKIFDKAYLLLKDNSQDYLAHVKMIYEKNIERLDYNQYLLEKSFEYRFLQKSPAKYNISSRLEKSFDFNANDEVVTANLWTEYQDLMSNYVNKIMEKKQFNDRTHTSSIDIVLNQEELAMLNAGKEIYLDLATMNAFGTDKEDIRLEQVSMVKLPNLSNGRFEVVTSHSGQSILNKGNEYYYFHQASKLNSGVWTWSAAYNNVTGNLYNSKVSEDDRELLSVMLGSSYRIDKTYVAPGALTFLKIRVNKEKNVELNQLSLKLDYSYSYKN
jgi:hypothetical protein